MDSSTKKVLIVGYGSIGKRHSEAFKTAGALVGILSAQTLAFENVFASLSEALGRFNPHLVVVANSTEKHFPTLQSLEDLGFKGIVLVEKPLASQALSFKHGFAGLFVAYNLRLSPLLKRLKQELSHRKTISANIYCGQHLPDWRPTRDYRDVYSAKKELGGGVLRDLSHEIDYVSWLLGGFKYLAAQGGHFSELEINSDDTFTLLGQTEKCQHVNLSINYLDRTARRFIIIHCEDATLHLDLVAGSMSINSEVILKDLKVVDTYLAQAQALLSQQCADLCTFDQGNLVLKIIESAEKSVAERKFIQL